VNGGGGGDGGTRNPTTWWWWRGGARGGEEERNRSKRNGGVRWVGRSTEDPKLRNSVLLQKNNLCISGLGYDLTCSLHCFLWEVNGMEWLLERSVR
jgi:hypothetical protein